MKLKIRNKELEFKKLVCLMLYYGFAQYLPKSNTYGNVGGVIRYALCKHIFKKCGKHVNIERKAFFRVRGTGTLIQGSEGQAH